MFMSQDNSSMDSAFSWHYCIISWHSYKSKFVPSITFDVDTTNNPNLVSFYNEDAHVGVKDSAILPTYSVRPLIEIGWFIMELNKAMFLFINSDGGGDRHHRFDRA